MTKAKTLDQLEAELVAAKRELWRQLVCLVMVLVGAACAVWGPPATHLLGAGLLGYGAGVSAGLSSRRPLPRESQEE